MEERPRQDVSDGYNIAGGVDNVKQIEVYAQAVFFSVIQANTTAVALDDSFMGSGISSDRCYF